MPLPFSSPLYSPLDLDLLVFLVWTILVSYHISRAEHTLHLLTLAYNRFIMPN
ncbi:hypothetical protein BDR03DRAFT_939464 [Suillus americanus]|nr:hypothetical protein BDR03DRAFT_939464 [Suillus americanus]